MIILIGLIIVGDMRAAEWHCDYSDKSKKEQNYVGDMRAAEWHCDRWQYQFAE